MGSAMVEHEVPAPDWADLETHYWADAVATRAQEDRIMETKFEARTGALRRQLATLFDEREHLSRRLQNVVKQCNAVEAELDGLGLQYEEAKQVVAAERALKDESAKAWFRYERTKAALPRHSQQSRDREGTATSSCLSLDSDDDSATTCTNSSSSSNANTSLSANSHATDSSTPADRSPISEPLDLSPPEVDLAEAQIYHVDGKCIGPVKPIHLDNKYSRQIVQIPIKRHIIARPGRNFSQKTMDSIYEPSDTKRTKWLSCMIQATGEEQDVPCSSCVKRAGTWVGCVIVGGEDFPSCANCEWSRQPCSGSSYHLDRSRDPDLQETQTQKPSEQGSAQGHDAFPCPPRESYSPAAGFTPVNRGSKPPPPPAAPADGPATAPPPRRKSLPTKKGGRNLLPNMAATSAKENVEPKHESVLANGEDVDNSKRILDAVDAGTEITKDTLALRDNAAIFTEPEIMRGVPIERITPRHPYWDPKWQPLDQIVQQKLDSWKRKLEECLALNKNRFLAGRQVNRGTTIMNFLEKTDFHPYQLVGKKWITKNLVSYDTIFRLAQVVEELPKLGVDVAPVAWLRQRMHELHVEQGEDFSLSKTIHELYHDPKLRALRTKAGVGNIGRPSGARKAAVTRDGKAQRPPNESPKKRRRESRSSISTSISTSTNTNTSTSGSGSGSVKQEEEPKDIGPPSVTTTPRSAKKQRVGDMASPEPAVLRCAWASPTLANFPQDKKVVGAHEDDVCRDGYTSTDSYCHDGIMSNDFRIMQLKTAQYTTNLEHPQYWHWIGDKENPHFEHQVLRDPDRASWAVYQEPLDFHLRLHEVDQVECCVGRSKVCTKILVHTRILPGIEHRGIVMASFKRDTTLRRFLSLLKKMGVALVERPAIVVAAGQHILHSGGVVRSVENWGVTLLPRPVSKAQKLHRKGHYFIMRYDASPAAQQAVRHNLSLDPRVIRCSNVKLGDNKLEALHTFGQISWLNSV